MKEITKSKKVILITLLVVAYCIIPMILLGILHPNFGYITCVATVSIVLYAWYLLHNGDESSLIDNESIFSQERASDR